MNNKHKQCSKLWKSCVLCNKNTSSANDSQTTHKMGEKYIKCYRIFLQFIFMNYISIIYIIKEPNGLIHWLYSVSESILPGLRLATWIPKFQCLIWYVPLFHPCDWFVLCQSCLSCVFLGFFGECSHANVLFCLFSCTHNTLYFHFAFAQNPK